MSVNVYYSIGPYAVWRVPEGERSHSLDWLDELDNPVECVATLGSLPTDTVGGQVFEIHRFVPRAIRPGCPRRTISLEPNERNDPADSDLEAIDIAAEKRWLTTAFAIELMRLTKYYGTPPIIRWGILRGYY